MTKTLSILTLAAAAWAVQPAAAQPPAGRDSVKKLEADVEKLRTQLDELEARLKKMKGADAKTTGKEFGGMGWGGNFGGPWGRGGWGSGGWGGKMDPEQMKKMMEADGKGGDSRPASGSGATDLERRLDRVLTEIEELRRELRRK